MAAYYANYLNVDTSIGLNAFTDSFDEVYDSLSDSQEHQYVLQLIKRKLLEKRHLSLSNPEHPFNKFADESCAQSTLLTRLGREIIDEVQERRYRGAVYSFFHSGGVNREELDTIVDAYWVYVDTVLGIA